MSNEKLLEALRGFAADVAWILSTVDGLEPYEQQLVNKLETWFDTGRLGMID